MNQDTFLFELGSTSLKLHFRLEGEARIRRVKMPWKIGHEVFQTGCISGESTAEAVSTIQMLLSWMGVSDGFGITGVATSAFRLAANTGDFLSRVKRQTGLAVRLISACEEASLLSRWARTNLGITPGFAFDLGGGSLQWVAALGRENNECGSIPLGAIQLFKTAVDASGSFLPCQAERLARQHLALLPIVRVERVTGTGGTVSALARVLERPIMRRADIERLEESVREAGPPDELMPHRRPIFLPGLILVLGLMKVLGAVELRHASLSVGEVLLEGMQPAREAAASPLWGSESSPICTTEQVAALRERAG